MVSSKIGSEFPAVQRVHWPQIVGLSQGATVRQVIVPQGQPGTAEVMAMSSEKTGPDKRNS